MITGVKHDQDILYASCDSISLLSYLHLEKLNDTLVTQ